MNYRLAPQAGPLEQADDLAKALAFAQSKAASWGADAARFVLMGHSAGAHLVALLAADPDIAARQYAQPWLGTVPLDSAAFDLVQIMVLYDYLCSVFPRSARKNRTPTQIRYRSAEGKDADCVSPVYERRMLMKGRHICCGSN